MNARVALVRTATMGHYYSQLSDTCCGRGNAQAREISARKAAEYTELVRLRTKRHAELARRMAEATPAPSASDSTGATPGATLTEALRRLTVTPGSDEYMVLQTLFAYDGLMRAADLPLMFTWDDSSGSMVADSGGGSSSSNHRGQNALISLAERNVLKLVPTTRAGTLVRLCDDVMLAFAMALVREEKLPFNAEVASHILTGYRRAQQKISPTQRLARVMRDRTKLSEDDNTALRSACAAAGQRTPRVWRDASPTTVSNAGTGTED